jgi:hypothetical protein
MLDTDAPVQPLREWAADLAARRDVVVPQFDPAEAGVDAKVLFVLEAPGPMTNAGNTRPGSGFISVDNDDETAANTWRARNAAGLYDGVLHWNIVPWYLGTAARKPTVAERREGAAELRALLTLLPYLEVVVLSRLHAREGWDRHVAPFLPDPPDVVRTWHPGAQSLNQPGRRADVSSALHAVAAQLHQRP